MNQEDELAAFIEMREAVKAEFEAAVRQLGGLRAEGKVKTATYKQLFARKMTLSSMLDIYKDFGLL